MLHFYKKIPNEPWPQIAFVDDHDGRARKLLGRCLRPFTDASLDDLLKFLLHKFGHKDFEQLPVRKHHADHWEKAFDLDEALCLDRDLFGDYYSEVIGKGLRDGTGYFPTPQNISELISILVLAECKLTDSVNDPCVGSARMLLSASNKSLFLSGMDINPTCIRMTLINGYLFAPQIAMSPPPEIRSKGRTHVIPRNTLLQLSAELQEVIGGENSLSLQPNG
jgi:hypothetical protein